MPGEHDNTAVEDNSSISICLRIFLFIPGRFYSGLVQYTANIDVFPDFAKNVLKYILGIKSQKLHSFQYQRKLVFKEILSLDF